MHRWLAGIALVLACGVATAGVVALTRPVPEQVMCQLPGAIFCVDDSTCVGYGAVCNTAANECVCASDGGVADGGASDLGGDLGKSDGGGGGTGGAGGGPVGGPIVGGGGTAPPKNGCSFVPGRAY